MAEIDRIDIGIAVITDPLRAGLLTAKGLIEGFASSVYNSMKTVTEELHQSEALGITIDQLQTMKSVAGDLGIGMDKVFKIIQQMKSGKDMGDLDARSLYFVRRLKEEFEGTETRLHKLKGEMNNLDARQVEIALNTWQDLGKVWDGLIRRVAVELSPFISQLADDFIDAGYDGQTMGKVVTQAIDSIASALQRAIGFMHHMAVGITTLGMGANRVMAILNPTELQRKWAQDEAQVKYDKAKADYDEWAVDPNRILAVNAGEVAHNRMMAAKAELDAIPEKFAPTLAKQLDREFEMMKQEAIRQMELSKKENTLTDWMAIARRDKSGGIEAWADMYRNNPLGIFDEKADAAKAGKSHEIGFAAQLDNTRVSAWAMAQSKMEDKMVKQQEKSNELLGKLVEQGEKPPYAVVE